MLARITCFAMTTLLARENLFLVEILNLIQMCCITLASLLDCETPMPNKKPRILD